NPRGSPARALRELVSRLREDRAPRRAQGRRAPRLRHAQGATPEYRAALPLPSALPALHHARSVLGPHGPADRGGHLPPAAAAPPAQEGARGRTGPDRGGGAA